MEEKVVVIGLGEIGYPLYKILSSKYKNIMGLDLNRSEGKKFKQVDIMHICIPGGLELFETVVIEYIKKFKPSLVIINSTTVVGTTRKIYEATNVPIAHSPVRGKHKSMEADLKRYKKYIGAIDQQAYIRARNHFKEAGLRTGYFKTPEASEFAKAWNTTYFGLLIAYEQELERRIR